ncbi:CBO0543 family protein [Paenibacillus arenilitoris]|uniref:Uncharacterized protein n=1 Tax=Paenibacillus arenilitoris TaxID=2772299 RepID=A0A927CL78_9BACL|nr:CBO0543 family protein [Paenibacillus arenilitoris]MBD2870089.1 hypothetical protein [Paenibacillus arenilitoris]
MNSHITERFKEIQQAREHLHELGMIQWKTENVFTWQWWLLVSLTILPLIIWWNLLDKKRAYEIAFYGCMINIMALVLDNIGTEWLWWGYPVKLLPSTPPLFTADSILVPIFLMLVYQRYSQSWKAFFVANFVTALAIVTLAEPLFVWLGYYQLNSWKFAYSFLFYMSASTLARFIVWKIVR